MFLVDTKILNDQTEWSHLFRGDRKQIISRLKNWAVYRPYSIIRIQNESGIEYYNGKAKDFDARSLV